MELRILRYFLVIAEEGSISRASEVLHTTQPTLSRQIKELEEELGAGLFIREKRKMVLTKAGMYLKDRAQEILSLSDKTTQEFFNQRKQLFSGHISIGCVEADNSDTLSMILEEFIADYPEVTFSIFSGTGEDIIDKLDGGLLDVGVLLKPISTEKYEYVSFPMHEKWGVLLETSSFLAQKNDLEPKDLKGVPLLAPVRKDVQKMFANWMEQEVNGLTITGDYNLIFNVFSLVENKVASALTIEGAIAHRQTENLRFIPLHPPLETQCVFAWRKNIMFSPVVQELIKRMNDAFRA
ncbi:LysR family transcriptional regulator [Gracilibacillus phocaeensis]|uniref:LysR family transcriptional regulator n=1 Tax=Gracilibacillus phocaeensis TaxID=2042304 RepID=UPI0010312AAB|nr:LysR family transcriptional regulator [Gracilibacillus phocaeensis]